jgi:iron complex transport system substrate-binding protein/vitamin B12 transport system substrate-binding protein
MKGIKVIFLMLCVFLMSRFTLADAVNARDATGAKVTLSKPASRLVALSPSSVEVLYEIGAGDKIVATVEYADYPATAKKLPRVGNAFSVSIDAIVRYRPDLVIAWKSQAQDKVVERLRELGIPVYLTNPLKFEDIARDMESLGQLTGLQNIANKATAKYRAHLSDLRKRFSHRKPIKVFMQINELPIFTVNDKSHIGQIIKMCGGRNVFANASALAPQVSAEAVVRAAPQAIFVTLMQRFDMWLSWPTIPAVAKKALYALPDDIVSRTGPRLPEGIEVFCKKIDEARNLY